MEISFHSDLGGCSRPFEMRSVPQLLELALQPLCPLAFHRFRSGCRGDLPLEGGELQVEGRDLVFEEVDVGQMLHEHEAMVGTHLASSARSRSACSASPPLIAASMACRDTQNVTHDAGQFDIRHSGHSLTAESLLLSRGSLREYARHVAERKRGNQADV